MRDDWDTPVPPSDPSLQAFGRMVRAARNHGWMTQLQFGRLVGLDQGSVSRLERGQLRGIRLYRLIPVLIAMGVLTASAPTDRKR